MDLDKKLRILEGVEERVYVVLESIEGKDMTTEEFQRLLDAGQKIRFAIDHLRWAEKEESDTPAPEEADTPATEIAKTETPAEAHKDEAKEIEAKRVAMRATLGRLRGAGIDVPKIIQEMGCKKFSEIPVDRYDELTKRCNEAKGDA